MEPGTGTLAKWHGSATLVTTSCSFEVFTFISHWLGWCYLFTEMLQDEKPIWCLAWNHGKAGIKSWCPPPISVNYGTGTYQITSILPLSFYECLIYSHIWSRWHSCRPRWRCWISLCHSGSRVSPFLYSMVKFYA